ncbi:MAG: hypothetical protein ACLPN6_21920 [Streptosporangiaceae bacterium]|jgi:hypothetical protein|nr:hypothetical protein [Actinomycetota bacterium]
MIRRGRRGGQAPVPMIERWAAAHDAGQVRLDSFSRAELDCVALDPDYLPADVRGPALQTVTPLLAELAESQDGRPGHPAAGSGPAGPAGMAALAGGDQALADAAASLEQRGYIRPGSPEPAREPVPPELAGWSANPAGQPAGVRRVAISGDLGIITRMRSQPYWVAEVSTAADPRRPDFVTGQWALAGRLYAAYRPLGALAERLPGPDGSLPPFTLVWDRAVLPALIGWCGIDVTQSRDPRPASGSPAPLTAELASHFASLAQVRVTRSRGPQVGVSLLVVAAGDGRQWLLEGEGGQRVIELRKVDLANRMIDLLRDPAEAGSGQGGGPPGQGG